jgi:hypothetical protein
MGCDPKVGFVDVHLWWAQVSHHGEFLDSVSMFDIGL